MSKIICNITKLKHYFLNPDLVTLITQCRLSHAYTTLVAMKYLCCVQNFLLDKCLEPI